MKAKGVYRAGQVGLVVLLIMTVMLTVGVSVASRSVTELRISRQEQESTRALDLAESGIEAALSQIDTAPVGTVQTITVDSQNVDYKIEDVIQISDLPVAEGHTVQVVLAGSTASKFDVSWTDDGTPNCDDAAIEVAIFNGDGVTVSRSAYRPSGCNAEYSAFTDASGTYAVPTAISFAASDVFARIKVLGADTTITVVGNGGDLAPQAKTITSTATIDDGTTRTVEVTKFADSYPTIFDYVLFSGNTLEK